jgi:hypothetical protein
MKDEHMLMCALVFVLGFMVSRMMGGRLVEGTEEKIELEKCKNIICNVISLKNNWCDCCGDEDGNSRHGFMDTVIRNNKPDVYPYELRSCEEQCEIHKQKKEN